MRPEMMRLFKFRVSSNYIVNSARYGTFLEPASFELGDFSQDIEPFLKKRNKNKLTVEKNFPRFENEMPVISCKNKSLNHYRNQTYDEFKPLALASKGWAHYKSKGDYFTINVYTKDFEVKENNKNLNFEDTNLDSSIIQILKRHGIDKPSKIQALGIPKVLGGNNILLAAETGCGKTLAYLAPLVQEIIKLKEHKETGFNAPPVIIITPSRELAEQIKFVVDMFLDLGINSRLLLGGSMRYKMLHFDYEETDILISTIGALSKMTSTGLLSVKNVNHLVLDEADCLMDDSFSELVTHYLRRFKFRCLNSKIGTQLIFASATMPRSLPEILSEVIEMENIEKVTTDSLHHILPHVSQKFLRVGKSEKPAYFLEIAKKLKARKSPFLVFCNKTKTCDWASMFLNENGINATSLNADGLLKIRANKFQRFQEGEFDALVGTDIVSRGLDTKMVNHVINYDFPLFASDYIHRCGRTGRLGGTGKGRVTNLVSTESEVELVQKVEKAARLMTTIHNVNANITKIIKFKNLSPLERKIGIPLPDEDDVGEQDY